MHSSKGISTHILTFLKPILVKIHIFQNVQIKNLDFIPMRKTVNLVIIHVDFTAVKTATLVPKGVVEKKVVMKK